MFFNQINEHLSKVKANFRKKFFLLLGFASILFILFFSIIIALSEIIALVLKCLLILSPIILGILIFFKIRKSEVRKFLKFIQDILAKIDDLLKQKKESELFKKAYNPNTISFKEILSFANDSEIETLEKFTGIKYKTLDNFELSIRKKSTNDISSLLKRIKGVDKSLSVASYSEMIDLAAKNFKLKRDTKNDADLERHIVSTQFEKMIKKMDQKDREVLELEIKKIAEEKYGKKNMNLVLSSSGLIAANLGGFATYTMATSLLGGISSAIGITLPFAAYTSLTSAISIALGPVGLSALTLWGIHKITSANIKTTILVVLGIAAIRERLIFEREEEMDNLKKEIEELENEKLKILDLNKALLDLPAKDLDKFILSSKLENVSLRAYNFAEAEERGEKVAEHWLTTSQGKELMDQVKKLKNKNKDNQN